MFTRTLTALALLVGMFSSACAYQTRPYLGFNLNLNVPQGDFAGNNLAAEEGGAQNGYGIGADVGLAGNIADVYLGYRVGTHDAQSTAFGARAEGKWTITQWALGARVHPKRSLDRAFVPMLGLALTNSRATADATGYVFSDTLTAKETSQSETSIMLEGGFLITMSSVAELALMLQQHDFDASFDHPLWNGSLNISYLTLHVGVVYRL